MTNPRGAFYDHSYAARGSKEMSHWSSITKSYGVHDAPPEVRTDHLRLVRDFVTSYDLSKGRVLEIGAGTGGLQDLVPNYVACDLSTTAARFFHKPFFVASATDFPSQIAPSTPSGASTCSNTFPNRNVGSSRSAESYGLGASCCSTLHGIRGLGMPKGMQFGRTPTLISKANLSRSRSLCAMRSYTARHHIHYAIRKAHLARDPARPDRISFQKAQAKLTHYWVSDSDAACSLDPFETYFVVHKPGRQVFSAILQKLCSF